MTTQYLEEADQLADRIMVMVMVMVIGFGMGWIFLVLGMLVRTPMTVMTLGFTILFPVTFASNIMVDPDTMPGCAASSR
ncbi:ABC transporter permease [Cereibacter sphaeroides]|uniref:ABC transporter permease n=1 Tax=Cereibacter sphaeroides TaxID=1063 RepID=UPI003AF0536F